MSTLSKQGTQRKQTVNLKIVTALLLDMEVMFQSREKCKISCEPIFR